MWQCQKCGERIEDTFETCWSCGIGKDGSPSENPSAFEAGKKAAITTEQQQSTSELEEPEEYFCTSCGAKVQYEDSVCPNCGADISEIESAMQLSAPVSKLAASTKPSPVPLVIAGILVLCSLLALREGIDAFLFWFGLAAPFALYTYFRRREWSRRNALDYRASQAIAQRLSDINSGRFEPLSDLSAGMRIIQGATVGEISQHFDQRVSASISGWLQHELSFHGWGVGVSVGRVGVGVGQLGLSGASSVNLDVSGVMRDNLGGDGFIAVLEQEQPSGMIDTIRIIAPSEPTCREYIAQLLPAIGATFGAGSHVDATFRRYAPQLAASFPCDVPHVSDQLRALLRQPPERRSAVSVVGDDLGGWAILGGAIRFGAEGPWQQLFSLSFTRAILSAAEDLRKNYSHHLLQPRKERNTT